MNLVKLVVAWLKENGYDGLYSPDLSCGCDIDDLMPCGEPSSNCGPGYRVPCNEATCEVGGGCDFHIAPTRAATEGDSDDG